MPADIARAGVPATGDTGQDIAMKNQRPSGTLDADILMLFEDGLRAALPDADEIIARAASRKRARRVVVGSIVLAAVAAGLFWANPAYRTEVIATRFGERGTWTLDDGSEIALNSDSQLTIQTRLRSRDLHLAQGEALFRVAHGRLRSFIVHAGGLTVEDIGTVFDVRRGEQGARVTVLEGQVKVYGANGQGAGEILSAGQGMQAGEGGLQPFQVADPRATAAWHEGKLVFDRTPLTQVIAEMQRYRAKPLRLAPALAEGSLRISGQFDIDHLDQLLGLLPKMAPVIVEHNADGSVSILAKADRRH